MTTGRSDFSCYPTTLCGHPRDGLGIVEFVSELSWELFDPAFVTLRERLASQLKLRGISVYHIVAHHILKKVDKLRTKTEVMNRRHKPALPA